MAPPPVVDPQSQRRALVSTDLDALILIKIKDLLSPVVGFVRAMARVIGTAIHRDGGREQLRRSETRWRALIENSPDAVALLDPEGRVLYASPASRRVLGYSEEELSAMSAFSLVHPDDAREARRAFEGLREDRVPISGELRVLHKDGSWRWVESVTTNLLHEPGVQAIVSNCRDITVRRRRETRIRHQAYHDPLTDLPNRILFGDRLAQSLARAHRSGRTAAVAVCDLDDFKRVNDTYGHAAGDRLLKVVSQRLVACLREDDTVGRMGGDEFTVILQDLAKPEDASLVARKLLRAVATPVDLDAARICVTTSLGISLYPRDGDTPEALLKKADEALYRAKVRRADYEICT